MFCGYSPLRAGLIKPDNNGRPRRAEKLGGVKILQGLTKFFRRSFSKASSIDQAPVASAPSNVIDLLHPSANFAQVYAGYIYSALSVRAEQVASSDFYLYAYKNQSEAVQIEEHPFLNILDYDLYLFSELRTKVPMNFYEAKYLGQIYKDAFGQAAFWIQRDNRGKPRELWLLNSRYLYLIQGLGFYKFNYAGIEIEPEELIRITFPDPLKPVAGLGILQASDRTAQLDYVLHKFQTNLVNRQAIPPYYLRTDQDLDKDDIDTISSQWSARFGGPMNAGKTPVVGNGLEVKPLAVNPNDIELGRLNEQVREEVLSVFRIPEAIIGRNKDLSRASAESSIYVFRTLTIQPQLDSWSGSFTRFLQKEYDRRLSFESDVVIPEDNERAARAAQTRLESGLTTINEERQNIGREAADVPFANEHLVRADRIPLSQLSDFMMAKINIATPLDNRPAQNNPKSVKKSINASSMFPQVYNSQLRFWERIFSMQRDDVLERLNNAKVSDDEDEDLLVGILFVVAAWNSYIEDKLSERYREILASSYEAATGVEIPADEFVREVVRQGLSLVEGINEETRRQLLDVITEGLKNGLSKDELAQKISSMFEDISSTRATRIAATEATAFLNAGLEFALMTNPDLGEKEWNTQMDEKVRPSHRPMHGQKRKPGESFVSGNGAELRFPGDPSAPADEVVNCRCFLKISKE